MRAAALALALIAPIAIASEPLKVVPSDTDSKISDFNAPHLAWLPDRTPRKQLLVFLPGTGGTPEKGNFHAFAQTAAALGYHVVALEYPDDVAAQQACSKNPNPDCHLAFRKSIIRGGTMVSGHVIGRTDSIENRLEKLLAYLDAQMRGKGWSDFLEPDGSVRWRNVAVSGQSQGGGHAYMIAKIHEVARVVMFGSPKDFSFHFHAPAKGFDSQTATPLKRFFSYNHVRDDGHGCTHAQQMQILDRIGLTALGVADADRSEPTYHHARVLTTDADVDSDKFHGAGLMKKLRGNPPVWEYMLTEPVS